MLIKDLLTRPILTIPTGSTIKEAAELMSAHGLSYILIINSRKEIIGILTERDVTKAVAKGIPYTEKVDNLMTKTIITVRENEDLVDALNLMLRNSIRHLVVIDSNNRFIGVISIRDVAQALGLMYDY